MNSLNPRRDPTDSRSSEDAAARLAAQVERLTRLIEGQLLPAIQALSRRLDHPSIGGDEAPGRAESIRAALRSAQWGLALELATAIQAEAPDDPQADALIAEVAHARQEATRSVRERLDAACAVHDADGVMDCHEQLAALVPEPQLRQFEHQVLSWLIEFIQGRMREGTVRIDVAQLAARVADHFPHTTQVAGLRASLPVLRRSCGLCPRCGEPYSGLEDRCPRCRLQALQLAPSTQPELGPEPPASD